MKVRGRNGKRILLPDSLGDGFIFLFLTCNFEITLLVLADYHHTWRGRILRPQSPSQVPDQTLSKNRHGHACSLGKA